MEDNTLITPDALTHRFHTELCRFGLFVTCSHCSLPTPLLPSSLIHRYLVTLACAHIGYRGTPRSHSRASARSLGEAAESLAQILRSIVASIVGLALQLASAGSIQILKNVW